VNVFLTFDYELFFGSKSGTVEKCLIQPSERLLGLSKRYDVKMTFFVDAGYLFKLKHEQHNHCALKADFQRVSSQLKRIIESGNDVQFHVHPHWEKTNFVDSEWKMVTDNCYKLSDFNSSEIQTILKKYHHAFCEITGLKPTTFRAGGWCVQPFSMLSETMQMLEITSDSSVMPGVAFQSDKYAFDFQKAPMKSSYFFEDDVCVETNSGRFREVPISTMYYSPLFFWKLYILGRLFPLRHKMLGDGNFVPQPGRKFASLTKKTMNHVSTDGYYASTLEQYHRHAHRKGAECSVVIGHPKSMTLYSFEKLEEFISTNKNKYQFRTIRDFI
jgi:hypothetical protein